MSAHRPAQRGCPGASVGHSQRWQTSRLRQCWLHELGQRQEPADREIIKRRGSALPHWTLHDLRRSFTTHVNELGFAAPHVTESILNHISGAAKSGVAGVYNRAAYLKERREALEQWGRYLTGLIAGPLRAQQSNTPEKANDFRNQLASGT